MTTSQVDLRNMPIPAQAQVTKRLKRFRERADAGEYPGLSDRICNTLAGLKVVDQEYAAAETFRRSRTPWVEVLDSIASDVVEGKPITEEAKEALTSNHKRDADQEAQASFAWLHLQDRLFGILKLDLMAALPEILHGLRDELEGLLVEIRATAKQLGDLDPTDGAAVAGATDKQRAALVHLSEVLRGRYEDLRARQEDVITAGDPPLPTSQVSSWRSVFRTGEHQFKRGGEAPSGADWFRRLLLPDVWLPDLEQLRRFYGEDSTPIRVLPLNQALARR